MDISVHHISQNQTQNNGCRHGGNRVDGGIDNRLDKAAVLGHLHEIIKTAEIHVFCQLRQFFDL